MLLIRILQGVGVGMLVSLLTGFILGIGEFNLSPAAIIIVLLLFTYLTTGFVAARANEHPYLGAGIAGFLLFVLNQVFTMFFIAPQGADDFVIGLLTALVLTLCGAVPGHLLSKRV